ncbi:G2/mitotic-specific cyclin-B [Halyomorpha halys]|uniref:G2/mitotic-specific cyclin-B n=1 Tax=Halyomorpha halys TaxID=286706 RepID=UPI0006D4DB6A|nr:G2/mitotic-specific cyclin-B [Halyomorpha halys]
MPPVPKKPLPTTNISKDAPLLKKKPEYGKLRRGLRDVSNVRNTSYEVINTKVEVACKHGQKLKEWSNTNCGYGSSKNITSYPWPKPCKDPKLNLILPNSKKEIIEDIDKRYEGNFFLVKEYAKHIYQYLQKLEVTFKLCKRPLKNSQISNEMRTILVDWLVDVHVEYRLLQETIHLAVYILDKYTQMDHSLNKTTFQLVGICSLNIACKYEEMFSPMVEDFIWLCKTSFTKKQFLETEQKIMKAINFSLGRPPSVVFVRRFNMASKANKMQHFYSKYFIDLVLIDSLFCDVKPSLVAASAVYLAMCIVNNRSDPRLWNATMIHYSSYAYSDIKPIKSMLVRLILASKTTKHDSVKRKYANPCFQGVSIKIDAHLELLKRILLD